MSVSVGIAYYLVIVSVSKGYCNSVFCRAPRKVELYPVHRIFVDVHFK